MIFYKTREEIELIRESAQLVSRTLGMLAKEIKPGVTSLYLDKLAETFIRDHGAEPGFLGFNDYPNSLCTSLNEQVVHGIPNNKPLEDGDIISIDCGAKKNGYYGDHAYTFAVGEVAPDRLGHERDGDDDVVEPVLLEELDVALAVEPEERGHLAQARRGRIPPDALASTNIVDVMSTPFSPREMLTRVQDMIGAANRTQAIE